MDDERLVTIRIISTQEDSDGTQKGKKEEDGTTDLTQKELSAILHPIKTFESEVIGKNFIVQQAYNTAKRAVVNVVEDYHARVFNLRESYLGEQNYNNVKAALGRAEGFMSAVAGGLVATGGNPVGALVAAGGYGVTQIISRWQSVLDYQQNLNATNIQTQFAAQRLSLYNDSKGTEN